MTALQIYQILFGLSIATNVFVGVACIAAPVFAARIMGMPSHPVYLESRWMRGWGGTLIALHVFFLAGLIGFFAPFETAFVNMASIGIKLWMAAIWATCGREFRMFAIWDAAWSGALLGAYVLALCVA